VEAPDQETLEEGAYMIIDVLKAPVAQEHFLTAGKKRKTWNTWNNCAAASETVGRRVKLEFEDAKVDILFDPEA